MAEQKPYVLCFNPYPRWSLHSARQTTILHGLRLSGCRTLYVLCDGVMAECDMFQPAKGPGYIRNSMSCTFCQAGSTATLNKFATPYRWISRWLSPSAEADANAWAQSLSTEHLMDACYENWTIGDWVRSSVHSHFRASDLDFDDPGIVTTYRSYLASGLTMAWGLKALFDHEKPDVQLLFNGRMGPTRVALEIAKQCGVRTIAEERGFAPNHLRLVENTHCLDPTPFYELWRTWETAPLTTSEIDQLGALLSQHKKGTSFEMPLFAAATSGPDKVINQLGLDSGRPIATVFTSATDESAHQPEAKGIFPSQSDWLLRTVEMALTKPDVQFVIRAHPNISGKRALGANAKDSALIQEIAARSVANIRVVLPDADVSSFDLVAASDIGLVWHSTVGLEMAAMGKPVVRAGAYWFREASFMHTPSDPGDYEAVFDKALVKQTSDEWVDRTIAAWRFAVCWFYRQSIHFPLVHQPDWARGDFNFKSLDALAPGQDKSLDQICSIVMGGTPLHPTPQSRDKADAESERRAVMNWIEH